MFEDFEVGDAQFLDLHFAKAHWFFVIYVIDIPAPPYPIPVVPLPLLVSYYYFLRVEVDR